MVLHEFSIGFSYEGCCELHEYGMKGYSSLFPCLIYIQDFHDSLFSRSFHLPLCFYNRNLLLYCMIKRNTERLVQASAAFLVTLKYLSCLYCHFFSDISRNNDYAVPICYYNISWANQYTSYGHRPVHRLKNIPARTNASAFMSEIQRYSLFCHFIRISRSRIGYYSNRTAFI